MSASFLVADEMLLEVTDMLPATCTVSAIHRTSLHTVRLFVDGAPIDGDCSPEMTKVACGRIWWAWTATVGEWATA